MMDFITNFVNFIYFFIDVLKDMIKSLKGEVDETTTAPETTAQA